METMRALVLGLAIAGAGGPFAALRAGAPRPAVRGGVWTGIAWPFALDQWGRGRAFRCGTADCSGAIELTLRAKIGFCNCASAVDDDEVDRVADFDLIGGEAIALGAGRPFAVRGLG